jgi:hypothetical protein
MHDFSEHFVSLLAFAALVVGVQWDGPRCTGESRNQVAYDGWSPRPTNVVGELFKRQAAPVNTCAYLSGIVHLLPVPLSNLSHYWGQASHTRAPVAQSAVTTHTTAGGAVVEALLCPAQAGSFLIFQ